MASAITERLSCGPLMNQLRRLMAKPPLEMMSAMTESHSEVVMRCSLNEAIPDEAYGDGDERNGEQPPEKVCQ
jgi:hypothetical protein